MSYYLSVLCESDERITRSEVIEAMKASWHGPNELTFTTPGFVKDTTEETWKALEVRYSPDKRPIVVHHNYKDKMAAQETSVISEELSEKYEDIPKEILEKVRNTVQIFAFELDRTSVPDECWEMLDCTMGLLAGKLDGIVYAPEDGIFDSNLKRIFDLR